MADEIVDNGRRSFLKSVGGGLVATANIAGGVAGTVGALVSYEALREAREASVDAAKIRDNTTAISTLAGELRSEQMQSAERSLRLLELQIQLVEVQRSIVSPTQRTANGVEAMRKLLQEMKAEKAALQGVNSRSDRVNGHLRRAAIATEADRLRGKEDADAPFGIVDPAPDNTKLSEKLFGR